MKLIIFAKILHGRGPRTVLKVLPRLLDTGGAATGSAGASPIAAFARRVTGIESGVIGNAATIKQ